MPLHLQAGEKLETFRNLATLMMHSIVRTCVGMQKQEIDTGGYTADKGA
jgi:hypothetical protein